MVTAKVLSDEVAFTGSPHDFPLENIGYGVWTFVSPGIDKDRLVSNFQLKQRILVEQVEHAIHLIYS